MEEREDDEQEEDEEEDDEVAEDEDDAADVRKRPQTSAESGMLTLPQYPLAHITSTLLCLWNLTELMKALCFQAVRVRPPCLLVLPFVRLDRSRYHDISRSDGEVSMKHTGNSPYW